MRLLVHEHVTGGGLAGEPLPPALTREADLMVRALVADLAEIPGLTVMASRDPRLPRLEGALPLLPTPGEDVWALYARGLGQADLAWPTAPETGGALERLATLTLAGGRTLLGCRPDAVHLTASKRATSGALQAAGVPVVPTFGAGDQIPAVPGPWVAKPDDGAGCDDVHLLAGWSEAREFLARRPDGVVVQPWLEGDARSLSLLCADARARLLSINRQRVRRVDGGPVLEALEVNAVEDRDGRCAALAGQIAAAVPGLWGYVGVDFIETSQGPVVLEINPRLTTSASGLRAALGLNLAALVLALEVPDLSLPGRRPQAARMVELLLGSAHEL